MVTAIQNHAWPGKAHPGLIAAISYLVCIMLKPSNTCYCNSVIQCLYFSRPFRERIIQFPSSPPQELINHAADTFRTLPKNSKPQTASLKPENPNHALRISSNSRESQHNATSSNTQRPTNKSSIEFQKRQALQTMLFLQFERAGHNTYGMPESLFTSLKDIFMGISSHSSKRGIVNPRGFLELLRRDYKIFRSPNHQDAHEFLNLLLNEVVDQVEQYSKRMRYIESPTGEKTIAQSCSGHWQGLCTDSSWVREIFEGTLTSETRCLTCEMISRRDEPFLDLSVDLEEYSSVSSCLRQFSKEEMLCERNKFHCDNCGDLQEAEKRMKIKRLPKILALHLKRFKYTEDAAQLQKLFHRVVFPFYLRLSNTTDDAKDSDRLYELYGIIVHIGSTPFHGHYVSIIKTQTMDWLLFDDELVLPVQREYVQNFFGGDPQNSACAYVLFYQETTLDSIEHEPQMDEPHAVGTSLQKEKILDGKNAELRGIDTSDTENCRSILKMNSDSEQISGVVISTPSEILVTALPKIARSPRQNSPTNFRPVNDIANSDRDINMLNGDKSSVSRTKIRGITRLKSASLSLRQGVHFFKTREQLSSQEEDRGSDDERGTSRGDLSANTTNNLLFQDFGKGQDLKPQTQRKKSSRWS